MQDRIPLYPGRVKMTPVAGQANTFDMVRADDPTQAGTPLNKGTLLKDTTAALFGLDVSNVPDDVLAFLGKYNQYWWKRRTSGFALVPNLGAEQIQCVEWQGRPNSGSYTPTNHIRYSPTVTVHEDLSVTLNNPQVLTFTPNGIGSNLQVLQGKYFYLTKQVNSVAHGNWGNIDYKTTPANVIYYASGAPTGKQNSADSEDYTYVAEAIPAKTVTGKKELHDGPWEYVRSSTRSAYPDSGVQDGYEYEYLGIPFDNAVTAPKIETGSYVGTGEFGGGKKNTLTFSRKPLAVIIQAIDARRFAVLLNGCTSGNAVSVGSGDRVNVSWTDTSVSWYHSERSSIQMNDSGITYYYIAIG